jgi:hypothetical protein
MSTKSALRADLDAEDRKTLAEDRKRMERLARALSIRASIMASSRIMGSRLDGGLGGAW